MNKREYYRVEYLTFTGWKSVLPMEVKEHYIIRLLSPNENPSPPIKDQVGGTVWIAVGTPFIRKAENYEGWAVATMRVNLIREVLWRIKVAIGWFHWDEIPDQ